MNWLLFVSGIVGLITTVGHFTAGSRGYMKPTLQAEFDPVARKIMHCAFHYISAFMVLSTLALLGTGLGLAEGPGWSLVARFIAVHYAAFAAIQIVIALTSGIDRSLLKLFQWILFIPIAVLAWLGACCTGT